MSMPQSPSEVYDPPGSGSRVRLGWKVFLLGLAAVGSWPGLATAQTATKPAPKEAAAARPASTPSGPAFEVEYPSTLGDRPITARVYMMLEPGGARLEPRLGPNWFRPQPFFAREVKDWKPGQAVRIDATAIGFPGPLSTLEPGEYTAQAVVRLNPDTHSIGTGEGNAYGPAVHVKLGPKETETIRLEINKVVPPQKFQETDRIKLAELESPLLSAFYHRPIKHRAAVILPEASVPRKLPTVYIIPGFGGDHHMAAMFAANSWMDYARDLIRVILDPDCGTGHHVFADSATNGPRGKALIEEFIPCLEKTFPLIAEPRARLLNGHSSGGWSSLWLQVTYPDFFGGTWSTSPDPVDFRDFQRINIYALGENMFRDRQGQKRPIARMGILPVIFYDRFSKMEEVMGPGGQLGSFEAVFSPVGADGQPRKLWNRDYRRDRSRRRQGLGGLRHPPDSGAELARARPEARGQDPRDHRRHGYLLSRGRRELLKDSLASLKSDAVVEIVPGRDHGTVLDRNLAQRLDREMKAAVASFLDPK